MDCYYVTLTECSLKVFNYRTWKKMVENVELNTVYAD